MSRGAPLPAPLATGLILIKNDRAFMSLSFSLFFTLTFFKIGVTNG